MLEEKLNLLGIKLSDTKSSAVGSFTQVVISGNLAFVSGQIPIVSGSNPVQVKFKGSPYAPVTIIDFSDFQCYLCARYVKNAEPKINETYIQTGKANLVFKHLPNRGTDSMAAAIAAQCTKDQDMFWQFHNLLYKNQRPIDSGWVSKDNLKKFASQIDRLDIQKYKSCFESQKYKSFVERDIALGASFGFHDTPNFIIVSSDGSNAEIIKGAQPFGAFKALVDKKL
jgi:protein-disulfide isomerase